MSKLQTYQIIMPQIPRQNRVEFNKDFTFCLEVSDFKLRVLNYSEFGLAVIHAEGFIPEIQYDKCRLLLHDQEICQISLRFVRSQDLGNQGFYSAFEITDGAIPVEQISLLPEIQEVYSKAFTHKLAIQTIPVEIRTLVYENRAFLNEVRTGLNYIERELSTKTSRNNLDVKDALIKFTVPILKAELGKVSTSIFRVFESTSEQIEIKRIQDFFIEEHKDLVYSPNFFSRLSQSFEYEPNIKINSLFSQCMEQVFLRSEETQAIRNRVDYLSNQISSFLHSSNNNRINILSLACGPVVELRDVIEHTDQKTLARTNFLLVDQDAITLRLAERQLLETALAFGKTVNLNFLNSTLESLVKSPDLGYGAFDLIYSGGLFDYLDDNSASQTARLLFDLLATDGTAIIGNFNSEFPGASPFSVFLNWNTTYRSKTELLQIFSIIFRSVEIESEQLAINLFAILKK